LYNIFVRNSTEFDIKFVTDLLLIIVQFHNAAARSVVQVVIGKAAHTAYIGGGVLILAHHKTFAALGRKLHENFESGGVLRHSHRKPQGNIAAAGGSFSAHKISPPAMYL
jgi:hypothetical protein